MSIVVPAWVQDAVFYQIFPDRFARSGRVPAVGPLEAWDTPPTPHGFKGGDLFGIADRLDELQELGVSALYLNPIFQGASNHRYHTYDYLAVDPLLGGDAALRELLDACHARGMRVVLDGVFNHASRGFWAFHHVLENGAASPYRDWFHFDAERLARGEPIRAYPTPEQEAALLREGASQHTAPGELSLRRLGYRAWWDLPALPKFNVASPAVRAYLLNVAEHWVRFGIDGWRLDVPEEIDDPGFWQEFRLRVKAANPDTYLVGEVWRVSAEWLQGDRFDALMDYPFLESVLGYVSGSHLDADAVAGHPELGRTVRPLDAPAFGRRLDELLAAYDPAVVAAQLRLMDSHDTPRFVSMAGGDRAAYRLAVILQMTLPGAPCIYYGDEVGMEGRMDPGCRGAFPASRDGWDGALRDFVRGAIALRRRHPALRGAGTYRMVAAEGMTHVHLRRDGDAVFLVAVNAGDEATALDLAVPEADGRTFVAERWPGWLDPAPWESTAVSAGALRLALPARNALVLRAV